MNRDFRDAERFYKKILFLPNSCWQWTGSMIWNGYAQFSIKIGRKHKTVRAARLSYEKHIGPIPKGLDLDHFFCQNRACVNPFHVEPVTEKENTLRGNGPTARNAQKTHCVYGHPFDKRNTLFRGDGRGRECRACAYLRHKTVDWRKYAH